MHLYMLWRDKEREAYMAHKKKKKTTHCAADEE
jgi:hypothetical protein